jgi:hypothetical protein
MMVTMVMMLVYWIKVCSSFDVIEKSTREEAVGKEEKK